MDSSLHTKRKAEDSPEIHPARRSCHDSADKPSPSVIGRVAEESSINAIIRNNNPRRLFTKPIARTSEHLQLLDCKFEFKDAQLETEDEPSRQDLPAYVQIDAPDQTKRSKSSKEAYSVKSALIRKTLLRTKKSTLWEILDAYNIRPQGSECLSFSYNLRKTSRLPTNGVFASDANPATLAYITFDHIQDLRSTHMRLYKASRLPILRHYYPSEVAESMSSDLLEDAYIVAALIALAQTQRRRQQSSSQATDTETDSSSLVRGPRPSEDTKQMLPTTAQSFKVQVLATPSERAPNIYIYTATISAEFLDKFDRPWRYSPSSPLVVTCHCLPVKNRWFLETLHQLLCIGSCEFCTGNHLLNRRPCLERQVR